MVTIAPAIDDAYDRATIQPQAHTRMRTHTCIHAYVPRAEDVERVEAHPQLPARRLRLSLDWSIITHRCMCVCLLAGEGHGCFQWGWVGALPPAITSLPPLPLPIDTYTRRAHTHNTSNGCSAAASPQVATSRLMQRTKCGTSASSFWAVKSCLCCVRGYTYMHACVCMSRWPDQGPCINIRAMHRVCVPVSHDNGTITKRLSQRTLCSSCRRSRACLPFIKPTELGPCMYDWVGGEGCIV